MKTNNAITINGNKLNLKNVNDYGKNLLGNAHMQEMGVHLMGANVKHETKELTPEEIAAHNKKWRKNSF